MTIESNKDDSLQFYKCANARLIIHLTSYCWPNAAELCIVWKYASQIIMRRIGDRVTVQYAVTNRTRKLNHHRFETLPA